jgi:His-Xaa-Ser system radical SAM maturase HxsC
MINLYLRIDGVFYNNSPYVIKIGEEYLIEGGNLFCDKNGKFAIKNQNLNSLIGDICIVFPQSNSLIRLIRPYANSNTILLTERCDQACVMCSQPPKNKNYEYYDLYKEAIMLAPRNIQIGISGGEPTLYKEALFNFLLEISHIRPDVKFHILSNAQHFSERDTQSLEQLKNNILWGIPMYSHNYVEHDKIVCKEGAYHNLLTGINILLKSGSKIELRTVILQQNYKSLSGLADFISRHIPDIDIWAIMQLERIGFAKMNWDHIFYDSSIDFGFIENALSIANQNNVKFGLYNFPLCTVTPKWRDFSFKTISDWKNKYLTVCDHCSLKNDCGGFFEWYNTDGGYKKIEAL